MDKDVEISIENLVRAMGDKDQKLASIDMEMAEKDQKITSLETAHAALAIKVASVFDWISRVNLAFVKEIGK